VSVFALVLVASLGGTNRLGETQLGSRRVPMETLTGAYSFLVKALLLLITAIAALMVTQNFSVAAGAGGAAAVEDLVFEVVSAFATVGLSRGLTPELTEASKIVIVLTMLAGRLGLISIAMPRFRQEPTPTLEYPRERILIG